MAPILGIVKGERIIVGSGENKKIPLAGGATANIHGWAKGGTVLITNERFATDVKLSPKDKTPDISIQGHGSVFFDLKPGQKMEIGDEDIKLKGT
ncbi:MAG: hypothetical protein M1120_00145 [Patescibacteria group bacterium]|nr:hypothetical protein [Patescibacteria group bacterium]